MLENDFKLIYYKDTSNPLVSLQLYIRCGAGFEDRDSSGFSHLTEHLIFKSTKKYPNNNIIEKVTYLGGSINAYTEFDSICIFITLPSKFMEEGLEILAELAYHSNFKKSDFKYEKKVVLEEFTQHETDHIDYFLNQIPLKYFEQSSYKKSIIGNTDNIKKADLKDLKKYYRNWFRPNNSFLVATGDFKIKNLKELTKKYFSNWEKKKDLKNYREDTLYPHKFDYTYCKDRKNLKGYFLAFVLPDLEESNKDFLKMNIINHIMGIGKNSRLFDRLVLKEKTASFVRLQSIGGLKKGINIYLVGPKNESKPNEIVSAFIDEFDKLIRMGITNKELEIRKKELTHSFKNTFEFVEGLAFNIGNDELHQDYHAFETFLDDVIKLRVKDINQALRDYIKLEHLQIFQLNGKELNKNKIQDEIKKSKQRRKKFKNKRILKHTFNNGLQLFFKKNTKKPLVGISLAIKASQLNERLGNRGINHLTATSMGLGNEDMNYKQLLDFYKTSGTSASQSIGVDFTSLNSKTFTDTFVEALEVFIKNITKCSFPPKMINLHKESIVSLLKRQKDFPQYQAEEMWKILYFGKKSNMLQKYGNNISAIKKISRKRIKNWVKNYYTPDNMCLTLVGNFDFDTAFTIIENELGNRNEKFKGLPQNLITEKNKLTHKTTKKGIDQAHIYLGGKAPRNTQVEDKLAFFILSEIIGGQLNSRLYKELREERGWAYMVGFDNHPYLNFGYFTVNAIVNKKFKDQSIELIKEILLSIAEKGVTETELEIAKNSIIGQIISEKESVLFQAMHIARLELTDLKYDYSLKREKIINNLELNKINQVAKKYFCENNFFIHVLE